MTNTEESAILLVFAGLGACFASRRRPFSPYRIGLCETGTTPLAPRDDRYPLLNFSINYSPISI